MAVALLTTPKRSILPKYRDNFWTPPKPQPTYAEKHVAYLRSRRMQPVYLLLAVLGITAIGAASVVALEVLRPAGYNSQAAYTIIGFLTPTVVSILALIKSSGNGQTLKHIHDCQHETAQKADIAAKASIATEEKVAEIAAKAAIPDVHKMHVDEMTVDQVRKVKP